MLNGMRAVRYWPLADIRNGLGRPIASQRLAWAAMRLSSSTLIDAGQGRAVGIDAAQFRMVAGAVIAFAVVLDDQLPIAFLDDGRFEGDLGIGEVVRRHIAFRLGAEFGERHWLLGQGDEDVAGHFLAMHGLEAELPGIDFLHHVARDRPGGRRDRRSIGDRGRPAWHPTPCPWCRAAGRDGGRHCGRRGSLGRCPRVTMIG